MQRKSRRGLGGGVSVSDGREARVRSEAGGEQFEAGKSGQGGLGRSGEQSEPWARPSWWRGSGGAGVLLNASPALGYTLASHFFWGLWSILQASMSTIEFGYLVSNPGKCDRCREGAHQGPPRLSDMS